MANSLAPGHERFAAELAKGSDQAAAYRVAYPNSKGNDNTVQKEAHKLSRRPEIIARVDDLRLPVMRRNGVEVERVHTELAAILTNDPRRFFRPDGSGKPPSEWDADMAAAVASIEAVPIVLHGTVDDTPGPGGKPKPKIGHAYKIKFWNKVEAIDKAMRHLGLFEKDNKQRQENLIMQVNLVGADPGAAAAPVNVSVNLIEGRRG